MLVIDNLETQTAYVRELTLESNFGGRLVYVVANQSAIARYRPLGDQAGSAEGAAYGSEILLTPQSSFIDKISGVQFRSAIAGSPARIIAQLSEPGDILPASGTPFTSVLSAAGGVAGVTTALFDSVLSAAAASFDATGIPSTSIELLCFLSARVDVVGPVVATITFNGDVGANYNRQNNAFIGAAAPASAPVAGVAGIDALFIPGTGAPAGRFGSAKFSVIDYATSAAQKTAIGQAFVSSDDVAGNQRMDIFMGVWRNLGAINRVTITPTAGNFIAGSRFTIVGL